MNTESLPERLILASSSKYRKILLERLGLSFECLSPEIDESVQVGESSEDLVVRLAHEKAVAVARSNPHAIVIGSDQIAVFDGHIIGKSGNRKTALKQLGSFSGQSIQFLTAVSVINTQTNFNEQYTDRTRVQFRDLTTEEIERYLEKEAPYDCAGSFKAESLGITLFEQICSEDPTALIGLPLIRTCAMLRRAGIQLP
jgi:septum formation protein